MFYGGNVNNVNHKIEPTILTCITWKKTIMTEEIFSPILILPV
ncbi:hypothetical protein [Paraliobacillus ryukyuensis]|nr:hypothetical protein [Paraliobacillus ryukyuensis]